MAAQEYYQGASAQTPAPTIAARPLPSTAVPAPLQVPGIPPYPLYDGPPPPYSPGGERPHSQPPPHRRPFSQSDAIPEKQALRPQQQPGRQHAVPRPPRDFQPQRQPSPRPPQEFQQQQQRPPPQADYDSHFRPPVRQQHSYAYPDDKRNGSFQSGQAQYQPPYGAQPVQPPYTNGYQQSNNVAFASTPHYRYPSRSRSRSRSRERGAKRHHQKKKSSSINTFLGAGGGAIIGDVIFPGLGTIGGALLGGIGGREYGKQKGKDPRQRERRYSDDYDHRPNRR